MLPQPASRPEDLSEPAIPSILFLRANIRASLFSVRLTSLTTLRSVSSAPSRFLFPLPTEFSCGRFGPAHFQNGPCYRRKTRSAPRGKLCFAESRWGEAELNWVTPVSSLAASPHLNHRARRVKAFSLRSKTQILRGPSVRLESSSFFSAPFRGNRENALHNLSSYHQSA